MNKIIIDSKGIKSKLNKNIEATFLYQNQIFAINKLSVTISKTANLIIENRLKDKESLIIEFNIESGVNSAINLYNRGSSEKIKYQYHIQQNCDIKVNHYNQVNGIKEQCDINLAEQNSSIEYILKTIATNQESYSFIVNHHADNTKSVIKTSGISIKKGNILVKIDAHIAKQLAKCTCNQYNQIINLNNQKCEIKPNLYIDSYDVEANHSALIGDLNQDDIFYLTSRGIDYNTAMMLIIKGFLLKETSDYIKEKIEKRINKYWR